MSLRKYISSKLPFLILNIIAFIFCAVIMTISSFNFSFILFVACIWFMPTLIFIFLDFFSKKKFYDQMVEITEKLDKKYLLPEIIKRPKSYEEQILYDVLRERDRKSVV